MPSEAFGSAGPRVAGPPRGEGRHATRRSLPRSATGPSLLPVIVLILGALCGAGASISGGGGRSWLEDRGGGAPPTWRVRMVGGGGGGVGDLSQTGLL